MLRHSRLTLILTLVFAPAELAAQPATQHAREAPSSRGRSADSAPQSAPAASESSDAVIFPQVLSAPISYPEGLTGAASVTLDLTLDRTGRVVAVEVISGPQEFRDAALAQAREFRFAPARRGGHAVAARIRYVLEFTPPEAAPDVAEAPPLATSQAEAQARRPPAPRALEVTVLGERQRPGVVSLRQADARLLPGSFGDPLRAIEAQPGVVPIVSGLPSFFIRGAPPANVGFFFDGIELPILYHAFFGPSVLHPSFIDRVDFYPGAAPASLGRFAGPVISVAPRPFASEPHANVSVRAIDAGVYGETPFASGACAADPGRECPSSAARVAGRYSYAGLVLSLLSNAELSYWDYQLQTQAAVGERDRLGLLAFGAFDSFRPPQTDTASGAAITFHRLDLRWDHRLGRSGNLRLALTGGHDRAAGAGDNSSLVRDESLRLRAEMDQRYSESVTLHAGVDTRMDRFGLETNPRRIDYPDYSTLFPARTDSVSGGYLVLELEPARRISVTPSLRADVYSSRGIAKLAVDPRISANFQISRELRIEHSLGIAHQRPNFAAQVPGAQVADLSGGLQWALLASSGVRYRLPSEISVSAAVFRSGYFNALDPIGGGRDFTLDRTSLDRRSTISALGLELTATRPLSRRLGGFVSYTLSRSSVTLGRTEAPSGFDRTHVLQGGLSYELPKRYRLGARSVFYTGIPELNLAGYPHFVSARRGRPFFRLDLRAEKRFSIGRRGYLDLVVEVLNATSTSEVVRLDCGQICRERTAGPVILPSVGVEAGF